MSHELSIQEIDGQKIVETMYANKPAWMRLGTIFDPGGTSAPSGVNDITEKNVEEWTTRVSVFETAFGALVYNVEDGKKVDRPITLADLQRRINLCTNASKMTKNQFLKNVGEHLWRDAAARTRNAKKKEPVPA